MFEYSGKNIYEKLYIVYFQFLYLYKRYVTLTLASPWLTEHPLRYYVLYCGTQRCVLRAKEIIDYPQVEIEPTSRHASAP